MRRLLSACVSALLLLCGLPARAVLPTMPGWPSGRIVAETVPALHLASNLLGEAAERTVVLYLPPSYDHEPSRRYPVLYILLGFGETADALSEGRFQSFRLGEEMDRLIARTGMPETIVVVVSGRNLLGGSFYADSPVGGNWSRFVAVDLVRAVDRRYRTEARSSRRGLAGFSMGGSGALAIALDHSRTFGVVYAISPDVFAPDGLARSQMFSDPSVAARFRALTARLAGGDRARYLSEVEALAFAGDLPLLFTLAYGAAYAPDTSRPPFLRYPLKGPDGAKDPALWRRWDSGLGGWEEKVRRHRTDLRRLSALGLECGEKDESPWTPEGCRYLHGLLERASVPHRFELHGGGHEDRLGTRLREVVLPWFGVAFGGRSTAPPPAPL